MVSLEARQSRAAAFALPEVWEHEPSCEWSNLSEDPTHMTNL